MKTNNVIYSLTTNEQFAQLKKILQEDAANNRDTIYYVRVGSLLTVYSLALTKDRIIQQGDKYVLSICGQSPDLKDVQSFRVPFGICKIFADKILGENWQENPIEQQIEEIRLFTSQDSNVSN